MREEEKEEDVQRGGGRKNWKFTNALIKRKINGHSVN